MRINKWLAKHTDLSRRKADELIASGQVTIDGHTANLGDQVADHQTVTVNGKPVRPQATKTVTVLLNKPAGYVCSHDGQGSPTIYELLPTEYRNLNIVGRLDKDSSGLLLLTNDGDLTHRLTHPSFNKQKIYRVELDKTLTTYDISLLKSGVKLDDGVSAFDTINRLSDNSFKVSIHEGRNRQIRRTFSTLGYKVNRLERLSIANYELKDLQPSKYQVL